jgi:hypothetical protein
MGFASREEVGMFHGGDRIVRAVAGGIAVALAAAVAVVIARPAGASGPPPTLSGVVAFGDTFGNPNALACNADFSGAMSFAGSGVLFRAGVSNGTFTETGSAAVASDLSVSSFSERFTFVTPTGTVYGMKSLAPDFADPSNPGFGLCTGATGETHANWSMEFWATIVAADGLYLDHGVGVVQGMGNNANVTVHGSGETFIVDSLSSDQLQTIRLTGAACGNGGYRTIVDPATGTFFDTEASCRHTAGDDEQPPVVALSVPAPVHGSNGWFDADDASPVNVTVSADDSATGGGVIQSIDCAVDGSGVSLSQTSGIGSNETASGVVAVAGDGTHTVSCSAADESGNRSGAATAPVGIDRTPPTVAFSGNAGTYTVDQTIAIHCAASDALSGLAASSCPDILGPASSFALGLNTFGGNATDVAGNRTTTTVSFTVKVTADSLCALIDQMLPGGGGVAKALQSDVRGIASAPNAAAKAGKLGAFRNHVAAQTGKLLTQAQADLLSSLAGAL